MDYHHILHKIKIHTHTSSIPMNVSCCCCQFKGWPGRGVLTVYTTNLSYNSFLGRYMRNSIEAAKYESASLISLCSIECLRLVMQFSLIEENSVSEFMPFEWTDGWEKSWEQRLTPWDLGQPTPVILHLLQTGALPKGRALIPGCGSVCPTLLLFFPLFFRTCGKIHLFFY